MKSRKALVTTTSLYIVMLLIAFAMLYPYIWMISSSFKDTTEVVRSPLKLWSDNFTLDAYKDVLTVGNKPIGHYLKNSLVITCGSVLLTLVCCSLGAYAMTRRPKKLAFRITLMMFMVSIMYPWALLVIPLYVIVLKIGLLGTRLGIILAITGGTGISLPVLIFQQFFKSIPYDVLEAADIDGASEFTIFRKIIFPMARPVFGTVALLTFMTNWGEWFYVSVLSDSMQTATLPVALLSLNTELFLEMNRIMAMATLVSVPIIILFVFTQRRVIEGIAVGSVKG